MILKLKKWGRISMITSVTSGKTLKDSPELLFENLVWLTTEEAAQYLRKSANAIRILVHRRILIARKFRRRLYFSKDELNALIETSSFSGGLHGSK